MQQQDSMRGWGSLGDSSLSPSSTLSSPGAHAPPKTWALCWHVQQPAQSDPACPWPSHSQQHQNLQLGGDEESMGSLSSPSPAPQQSQAQRGLLSPSSPRYPAYAHGPNTLHSASKGLWKGYFPPEESCVLPSRHKGLRQTIIIYWKGKLGCQVFDLYSWQRTVNNMRHCIFVFSCKWLLQKVLL